MAKLPKNIIKKYGISKKAWSVFRSGRSGGTTVAKRKKYSGFRRRMSRSGGFGSPGLVTSGVYGYARGNVNTFVKQLTANLPVVSNLGDEVGLGLAAWAIKKWGPAGLRSYADAAMNYEAARLGERMSQGGLSLSNLAGGTTSGGLVVAGGA